MNRKFIRCKRINSHRNKRIAPKPAKNIVLLLHLSFIEYRMAEVKKGVSDNGYTKVILIEGFNIISSKVVVMVAHTQLPERKNAGEMAC